MTVEYLDLAEYITIATEITGLGAATIMKVASLDHADSALHAPAAGFGETEFYPDFVRKAAVLIVRLAKNHPLPDGNKRVSCALRVFIEINGWSWSKYPSVDEAEQVVLAIASDEVIVEFIDTNRDEFGVEPICRVSGVSEHLLRGEVLAASARALRDAVMTPIPRLAPAASCRPCET